MCGVIPGKRGASERSQVFGATTTSGRLKSFRVTVTVVGFHWIYNRQEPKFLTPLVDKIAPFLPSAGSYKAKQHE